MNKCWNKVGEEIVFEPEIILNTFSKWDLEKLEQFKKTEELKKQGLFSTKISRILNVPRGRVDAWFRGRKPIVLKSLEIVKRKGWLPISTDDERFVTILDIFTWIFGDGHLRHNDGLNFSLFGQRGDLEKIKLKIEELGLVCEIIEDPGPVKNIENLNPDTSRLVFSGNSELVKWSFGKLLISLGAPVGNKVKTNFLIPEWVFELKPKLKKRFLEVFLSNEATIRGLEGKDWLPQLDVRMRKMESNVNNLIDFLDQIRILLSEFGVKASPAKIQSRLLDKHGRKCVVVLSIPKSIVNIFNFSHNFELIFAKKKQTVLGTLKVASENKIRKHIKDIEGFTVAHKLRKQGIGARRVAKIINKNVNTVIGWFHQNNKPIFWGKERELKNLLNGRYVGAINNDRYNNCTSRISHSNNWGHFSDN